MIARVKQRRPVVLVVEDDDFLRISSACELTAEGFKAVEARSADEALVFLKSGNEIDAVFTDISMPGTMNGVALAQQVRCLLPRLYVLITSGDTPPSGQPLPRFSDFVPKPYTLVHIAELIRAHIPAERPS